MARKSANGRMQVAVRVRPVGEADGEVSSLSVEEDFCIRSGQKEYAFDRVFAGSQADLYSEYGRPMVEDAVNGYNTCLFAYGQTGSGKTYTLLGLPGAGRPVSASSSAEHEGLLPRFLMDLCAYRHDTMRRYPSMQMNITMSVLEIYNEDVRDLLRNSPTEKAEKGPMLVEDSETKQIVVVSAVEAQIDSAERAMELLAVGVNGRETAATQMNEMSSRSHMIVILTLKQRHTSGNLQQGTLVSNIKFVDLAGSECLGRTGTQGIRRREGGCINKSLLTLGKALNSFSQGAQMHEMKGMLRESKLTRLLSENFGGNSRTRMLAMVSPLLSNEQQTASTLSYATRAKTIALHATQNKLREVEANKCKELRSLLEGANAEVESLREALRESEAARGELANGRRNVDREISDLRKAARAAEDEQKRLEASKAETLSVMKSQSEHIEQLSKQLQQTEAATAAHKARVDTLETQLQELTDQAKAKDEQHARTLTELRSLEDRVSHVASTPAPSNSTPLRPIRPRSVPRVPIRAPSVDPKHSAKLSQQLSKAAMTQDYLKEDLQQQIEKSDSAEIQRRNAVATTHGLQAQLAGVQNMLREEKKKNALYQGMLQKHACSQCNCNEPARKRHAPASRMGRAGVPSRDTVSSSTDDSFSRRM